MFLLFRLFRFYFLFSLLLLVFFWGVGVGGECLIFSGGFFFGGGVKIRTFLV